VFGVFPARVITFSGDRVQRPLINEVLPLVSPRISVASAVHGTVQYIEGNRLVLGRDVNLNKALIPILGITLVDVLGFTMLIPILPYYAEHYGASPVAVGLIYSTVALCALVASPFWGRLSDGIGRKGVLLAAQVASAAGFTLLGIGGALWVIYVARAIEGLGGGGLGVTQAYVSDVTTPQERARAFGLVGATFGIGFLIGPALSGTLVRFGYPVPLFLGAALAVTTVVLTIFLLPESHTPVGEAVSASLQTIAAALRAPDLGTLLLAQFAFSFAFYSWISIFALFVERVLGFGPSQSSFLFVISASIGIVVQAFLIGKLVDRFGEGRIAIAGLSCAIAGYAAIPYVSSIATLLPIVMLWALSGALIRPSFTALISRAAPASMRGALFGVNDSLGNVAFLIAPLIATAVLTKDVHAVGAVPVLASIAALAIGWRVFVRPPLADEAI
jgi:DHA1 family tetracycline resistance protein-like MFS transporter